MFHGSARPLAHRAAEFERMRAGNVGRRTQIRAEDREVIGRSIPGGDEAVVRLLSDRENIRRSGSPSGQTLCHQFPSLLAGRVRCILVVDGEPCFEE